MNVKNVVVGIILVVFGAFIGYSISSKVGAKCEKAQECTAKKECRKAPCEKRCGMKPEGFCPKMCVQLNLTDDQKAQVKALFDQKAEQKAAQREECHKQKQAECAQFQEELNKILTPEQQAKLAEMKAECKAKRAECAKAKQCDKKCGDAECCKKGEAGQCKKECAKQCAKGETQCTKEKQCTKDAPKECPNK
jgi:hypothetical protein